MKIEALGAPQVIMSNPQSRHNYFGWPTVARLQNGKIAVVASGFRLRHVCPFGKTVISYSENEGETYTAPAAIFDTVLDDRDGGIMTFGEKGVVVTSFNNTLQFQRQQRGVCDYSLAYLDTVTPEEEEKAVGASFRISMDCGVTFGPIFKSPITSPHGPVELHDGTLLWVGRTFCTEQDPDFVQAYRVNLDGTMTFVGRIDNIFDGCEPAPLSVEPHAMVLKDGTILVHIRVQRSGEHPLFTIYQSKSRDGGVTWTRPRQLLAQQGGSPPHLMRHSSGVIICTYGYRQAPSGIRAMFSRDEGETWQTDYDIYVNNVNWDLGYPSTVELHDGSLLTVFYAHPTAEEPAVIMQQKWRMKE